MTFPSTQLERDELQARLVDAYLDKEAAEIDLHVAAQSFHGSPGATASSRLLSAAHAYGAVCQRTEQIKEGVTVEVLYGSMLIGHALHLAEVIRNQRREREEAAAEVSP